MNLKKVRDPSKRKEKTGRQSGCVQRVRSGLRNMTKRIELTLEVIAEPFAQVKKEETGDDERAISPSPFIFQLVPIFEEV